MIFNNAPLLGLLIPYIAGIVAAEHDIVPARLWWLAGMAAALGLATMASGTYIKALAQTRMRERLFVAGMATALVCVGMLTDFASRSSHDHGWDSQRRSYRGVVAEPCRKGARSYRVTVWTEHGSGFHKVELTMPQESIERPPLASDAISFAATIRQPYNFGDSTTFDYAKWLRRKGVEGMAYTRSAPILLTPKEAESLRKTLPPMEKLKLRALKLRDQLQTRYTKLKFEEKETAILSAITLGDKSGLRSEVRNKFSEAGVSHVLALSGLHLGILMMFLMMMMRPMRLQRWSLWLTAGICVALLWSFVLLTGCSVSVVRSAVMLTLVTLLGLRGEGFSSLNNVALAAFAILAVSPQSVMDVSFQLSFVSVGALVMFTPYYTYSAARRRLKWAAFIGDFVYASVVAQLATAPIVACVFGKLPIWFLAANAIVIPCAYVLLPTMLLYFAFLWFTPLAQLLGEVAGFALKAMLWGVDAVSSLPHASIEVSLSPLGCMLTYSTMLSAVFYLLHHTRARLLWTIMSAGLLLSVILWEL